MSTRLYVGGLPLSIDEHSVASLFSQYGPLRCIDLKKPSRPPAFAFVQFEDAKDAESAMLGLDGYKQFGPPIKVDLTFGTKTYDRPLLGDSIGNPSLAQLPPGLGVPGENRVLVRGLPPSASWQDLKDTIKQVNPHLVTSLCEVVQDGDGILGVVDFKLRSDMDAVIRQLDRREFVNAFHRAIMRLQAAG